MPKRGPVYSKKGPGGRHEASGLAWALGSAQPPGSVQRPPGSARCLGSGSFQGAGSSAEAALLLRRMAALLLGRIGSPINKNMHFYDTPKTLENP